MGEYKVSRPHSAGHESEADVLGAKAVTKNSMQEPGSPQRPIRASSSHQSKEINTVLPANLKFGNKNINEISKDNKKNIDKKLNANLKFGNKDFNDNSIDNGK